LTDELTDWFCARCPIHALYIERVKGQFVAVDIALLRITGAVFHQVPTRAARGAEAEQIELVVTTRESKLEHGLPTYLRDRLNLTFKAAAQPVMRDEDLQVPTPDLVLAALREGEDAEIVERFQALPALLLEAQSHNSPRGLLAVIRGSCGAVPVVVLVKVEQERGLSFDTFEEDGEVRVEVVIEDSLVFTEKTDVFKAAIFHLNEDCQLEGVVTDDQTGSMYRGPVSQYWLTKFLGCRYSREVDVMTRSWVKATERLVKSDIDDPATKNHVLSAMVAELHSNRNGIDPDRFIADHVPPPLQDQATQRLRDAGAPTTRFPKSRDVAANAPRRKKFRLDGGIEVTMPADVDPDLSTEETGDGQTIDVITIRGRIRSVE